MWAHFLNLLNRPDGFIQNMTARIVAKMACWSPPGELMAGSDLQFYLTWLKDQLRMQNNEYVQSVARCLQMMLRIDDYRLELLNKTQFEKLGPLTLIESTLLEPEQKREHTSKAY